MYLNNAGTTWPKPASVYEAAGDVLRASPDSTAELLEPARMQVARFLGMAEPSRLLFTTSCTAALQLGIADLPWQDGDVVLTSHLEHHALVRPVLSLQRTRGVRHVMAPYAPGTPIALEFVEETLRQGRVRLVACSMASNVTGEVLPALELVQLAHRHGALCLLDAAQTAGILSVDAARLGVDLLVFAGHKGTLAPLGIGGLYAAPNVQLSSPAASCEIGGEACELNPFPSFCDVGSINMPALAGLSAGLSYLEEHGVETVSAHAVGLADRLRAGLAEVTGVTVFGTGNTERSATLSLAVAGVTPSRLEQWLQSEHGVVARAGHHCAPLAHTALGTAAEGTIRFSFGAFNTSDEVDQIVALLTTAARGL